MKTAGDVCIHQFQQGEESAFAAIYHQFFASIYSYARHFVPDAQEARDITAETFIKLWRLRGNFDNVYKIKTFLHVTARNACIDVIRHQKWKTGKLQQLIHLLMDDSESTVTSNISPMAAPSRFINGLVEADLLSRVYKQIEDLPPQRKIIFKLYYLEGLKNADIAGQLKISVQTVQNQKTIALKFLRQTVLPERFSGQAV